MDKEIQKLMEKLSPLEIKIIPYLNLSVDKIQEKAEIDETSVLRALKFLENKEILKIKKTVNKIVDLGKNGIYYKKTHLPERKLLTIITENNNLPLEEAKKLSKLTDNEFNVSLGALKSKVLIEIKNNKIIFTGKKEEITKKTPEEHLLDILPIEESRLKPEELYALNNLKKRKDIVEIKERNIIEIQLTEIGKQIAGKDIKLDLIEELTPEIIKNWKNNKKFRSYDLQSPVPQIHGGKKHFVNQSIEYGKRIWLDMGFKEMTGTMTQTSFWNFDALFTAQDHPVREMHDTFFIKDIEGSLPAKELVAKVKKSHETGSDNSKGWQYQWKEKEAQSVVLRTHTTCLSAQTLAKLKLSDLPAKFFAIGKVFRNETVDWKHGFEFNQTEGIVVDKNTNLRHLIGYLTEFAKKMGFDKVKFQPSFFPYTEPSIEGLVWSEKRKEWVEVFAAGIFRPEVTTPLLGSPIPVLAWGPGFDRLMLMAYQISDMRGLYANDLKVLREKQMWKK